MDHDPSYASVLSRETPVGDAAVVQSVNPFQLLSNDALFMRFGVANPVPVTVVVTLMLADVVLVSPGALNVSVWLPVVAVMDRFVNVATPEAFVVAVSVPPSVPPPEAIAAVTTTPLLLTAWFDASRN
jgi:hypothetical protein